MIMIQGRTGSGKSKELLKRFCEDKGSAEYITSKETLEEIARKIAYFSEHEEFKISNDSTKNIYFQSEFVKTIDIIANTQASTVYVDVILPCKNREEVRDSLLQLEQEKGIKIVLIVQLPYDMIDNNIRILEVIN